MLKFYDTKEPIPNKSSVFMVFDDEGKHPKYFKTKETYELWDTNNKYRGKVLDLFKLILGYETGMKWPTCIFKHIDFYKDKTGYDVLYNTVIKYQDDIEWALRNKEFKNEPAKITYIFMIIQNHYMEEWQKKKARLRTDEMMIKLIDDPNLNCYDKDEERKIAVKDISQFIKDDD